MANTAVSPKPSSSADVFSRVNARLQDNDAARSLWQKIEQEMAAGNVVSAADYLRARFKELSARIEAVIE